MTIYEFLHLAVLLCAPMANSEKCVSVKMKCAETFIMSVSQRYHPGVRICL